MFPGPVGALDDTIFEETAFANFFKFLFLGGPLLYHYFVSSEYFLYK